MTEKYPSEFIQKFPTKIAFLIDCVDGINIRALYPRFLDNFPLNSDIFLFHNNEESGMNRRLKRFASNNHGVYFISASENAISINLSFILGQINDKYNDFILVCDYDPINEDICEKLIETNIYLKNHVQLRCFNHLNEFRQFLNEMIDLQNEEKHEQSTTMINYSKENLFHSCPFETKQQSSYLYRFAQLIHHLDIDHPDVSYKYCAECEEIIENRNSVNNDIFEKHLQDKHWGDNQGFQLSIQLSQ